MNYSLLVGAPRANSTHQRGLVEPGAVFQCSVYTPDPCQQVKLDDQGKRLSTLLLVFSDVFRTLFCHYSIIPVTSRTEYYFARVSLLREVYPEI